MNPFDTGLTYIRRVARSANLIADSDNDDVLVQRVASLIKSAPEDVCAKIREDVTKAGDTIKEPEPPPLEGSGSDAASGSNAGQQS